MVTRKEIRVQIDRDGRIHLEPIGASGGQCLEWTRQLEEALGSITEREMKPEYYANTEIENDLKSE